MKEKEKSLTPEELVKRRRTRRHIFLLILNTVLFFGVYQALLYYAAVTDQTFWSFAVMLFYLLLTLGFTLGYLIYNRFLYRKGLTPEQLPTAWSEQQKADFLADGNRRLERSKWMMTIILPLILTFLFDAIDLFFIDSFLR
ncbi:MAG: hypothetical protein E7590_02955 [Ruminococcaceae bacterium]|nr:hypothetical protein [Oscillospiraceae bacterium]